MKILVIGSYAITNEELKAESISFTKALGKKLIKQGHTLVNACSNKFDAVLAKSAFKALDSRDDQSKERIIGYLLDGKKASHNYGKIRNSEMENWGLETPKLQIPEPIEFADVVIIVAGAEGTLMAANLARIANKPILPIVKFGGAAKRIYQEERNNFDKSGMINISLNEFEDLSETSLTVAELAKTILSLAERIEVSKNVFVIMPFSEDPGLKDAYESFKEVCSSFSPEYTCQRMDEILDVKRITPVMLDSIKNCAFVIVDLTFGRPNVYYEFGYADALDKPIIVLAKKGTEIHFDAKDFQIIFWESQTQLKKDLHQRIKQIAFKQGRKN